MTMTETRKKREKKAGEVTVQRSLERMEIDRPSRTACACGSLRCWLGARLQTPTRVWPKMTETDSPLLWLRSQAPESLYGTHPITFAMVRPGLTREHVNDAIMPNRQAFVAMVLAKEQGFRPAPPRITVDDHVVRFR